MILYCLPNTNKEGANIAYKILRYYIEQLSVRIMSDKNVEMDINITVSIGLVLAYHDFLAID